jgi:hypothetical protein
MMRFCRTNSYNDYGVALLSWPLRLEHNLATLIFVQSAEKQEQERFVGNCNNSDDRNAHDRPRGDFFMQPRRANQGEANECDA